MSTHETIPLLICPDCALWVANHDDSGSSAQWRAWLDGVDGEPRTGEGAMALAPIIITDGVHDFIPRPCEAGCPNTLAGQRFNAEAYVA